MTTCARCNKTVYDAEEVKSVGKSWHQQCYKCAANKEDGTPCKAALSSANLKTHEGEIYCENCFQRLYAPAGAGGTRGGSSATYGAAAVTAGLDADAKKKQMAKYDPELEAKAKAYVEAKTGLTLEGAFGAALKDGVALAILWNKVGGGKLPTKAEKLAFKQMELIGSFLKALADDGFKVSDTFMTVDLYEEKNLGAVVDCILNIARKYP